MSKLNRIQHWAGENEEVYVAVIKSADSEVPAKHWDSFVDGLEHRAPEIWEEALEALNKAYDDWKEEEVCAKCDETFDNCDCEPDEEEEEEDSDSE